MISGISLWPFAQLVLFWLVAHQLSIYLYLEETCTHTKENLRCQQINIMLLSPLFPAGCWFLIRLKQKVFMLKYFILVIHTKPFINHHIQTPLGVSCV